MNKELKVPKELQELLLESRSAMACRDYCVLLPFGMKKAIKFGKIGEKKRVEFWVKLEELYPEISKNVWVYDYTTKTVSKEKTNAKI